ncbi:trichohyalin [Drosophila guanche]|uniref:Blast:Centrosome-associated protein CEP250 n=1 Tax=Drosophila guanche TaxID=7266 RepID=A0A3B0J9L7_DROGU|nr:trichohyalin [Drosophila guanche]SPP76642.1 blast:Centrosome-associated protein CEP250 [Drosophila guanche]
MQYSWLPQERREVIIREKPPLVISNKRFASIQANASQAAKQERLYRLQLREQAEEQLRIGGEELLRQFGGKNLVITKAEECRRELQQQREQELEAKRLAEEEAAAARREAQRTQKERIAAAKKLLEELRPGPRELQCARLQSEVLRSVQAQREVQVVFAQALEQKAEQDRRIYQEQVLNGIDDTQRRRSERCQQLREHKQELLGAIAERERERQALKAEEYEQARQERERNQRQLREQQHKEEEMVAARRRQKREEALASLAMAEQRHQRLLMLEEVEQVQCDIHNEAKGRLEQMKQDRARNRVQKRIQRNEKLAQLLAPRLHYSAGEDEARHKRQLVEMQKAHSAEQAKRRQSREQAKNSRLAIQREEEQLAQAAKQQAEADKSDAIDRRLKNDLVHVQFKRQQRQEQLQRVRQLRQQLDEQVRQRHEEETRPETNYNREAQLECLREDAFFFDYAHQLMDEAQARGCPLKPFVRAVGQYKNENRIGAGIRVPPHMVTRLPMGRRTAGDSAAETEVKAKSSVEEAKLVEEEEQQRRNIEESLKKIETLVLAEATAKEESKKG